MDLRLVCAGLVLALLFDAVPLRRGARLDTVQTGDTSDSDTSPALSRSLHTAGPHR